MTPPGSGSPAATATDTAADEPVSSSRSVDPRTGNEQVGALAAILLDVADETADLTVARARIRREWIETFPELVDGFKPVHGGGQVAEAPRARRALQHSVATLVRAGLVRRIADTHLQILNRAALERLAPDQT